MQPLFIFRRANTGLTPRRNVLARTQSRRVYASRLIGAHRLIQASIPASTDPPAKRLFVLEWRRHILGAAMINPENSRPKILDVPAFLRDPRPSERLRCPTLLVAWLQKTGEPSEPEREAGATDDTNEDRT